MKYDTITINETDYRVEFNWNAITDFLESQNLGLADADDLRQLKPSQITALVHSAVKEGARLEQKEFPYTVRDFGAAIGAAEITALLQIYKAQTETATGVQTKKKKMKFSLKR